MRSSTPLARLLAAGAFAAAMVPQTPAGAATPVDQTQHFIDCLGWMFSDPDRHRSECSPGHEFFLPGNFFSQGGITGEPPPPPPPPPPPEESCDPFPGPVAFRGEGTARLLPVVFCCDASWRPDQQGARLLPVVACCDASWLPAQQGARLFKVISCIETDASPADRWLLRPAADLLV